MSMRTRAILLLAMAAASCGRPQRANEPRDPADGLIYGANVTVIDDGGPVACTGGVAESLPPQCVGDLRLRAFSWEGVNDAVSRGDVTWGDVWIEGTYDGDSLTVTHVGPLRSEPPNGDDASEVSPCPEPAGGWDLSGWGPGQEEALIEAMHLAESSPDSTSFWVSYVDPPGGQDMANPEDPGPFIANAGFTGDLASHERDLRAIWDGPLCVYQQERTFGDLKRIQRELDQRTARDLGVAETWSGIDVFNNRVELGVVIATPEAEDAFASRYGEGTVLLVPMLRPVPGPSSG